MHASQCDRHKLNTYLNNEIVIDYDLNHEISKPGYVTESNEGYFKWNGQGMLIEEGNTEARLEDKTNQ